IKIWRLEILTDNFTYAKIHSINFEPYPFQRFLTQMFNRAVVVVVLGVLLINHKGAFVVGSAT
ncbi:MAG: hypothetical protein U0401_33410, partial [Anaerolineae bacterium]